MKKIAFLLICFVLVLSMSCCVSDPVTCSGTITYKEYQEPAWGIGIGQNNRGTIGAVPMLKPGQYLVTVRILDRDDVFSIGQDIYEGLTVGDIIACKLSGDFFTCNFEEN